MVAKPEIFLANTYFYCEEDGQGNRVLAAEQMEPEQRRMLAEPYNTIMKDRSEDALEGSVFGLTDVSLDIRVEMEEGAEHGAELWGGGGGSGGQGQRRTTETYTVITRDSYGDSRNGGVLRVIDTSTSEVVATSTGPSSNCKYSPPSNTCERTETVSLSCGIFSASQAGSSFNNECSWVIKDSAGSTVAKASGTSSSTTFIRPCASCGLGSGSVGVTNECEACPVGKYSDVDGPGFCKICEAGKYR